MNEILERLRQLGSFAAYAWSHAPSDNYGVIAIDGQTALRAGNATGEKIPEGTIDWYTRNPSSAVPGQVEDLLDSMGASWYLNSVQYEEGTGLLHWEWVWQYG